MSLLFVIFASFTAIRAESQSAVLPDDMLIPYRKGDYWGYCNPKKEIVIPVKYSKAEFFYDGMARVKLDRKEGYIDTTGREIIPLKYDGLEFFSQGLAAIMIKDEHGNSKWGFIDTTSREICPLKYDDVSWFIEGLAQVRLGVKYGFIDQTGREIIPLKYDIP